MYYFWGGFFIFLCLFFLFFRWRKKKVLCRLASMNACQKYGLLNAVLEPLGYSYHAEWDIFSSRTDAWQKQFGYGAVYDRLSPFFNMFFQTLPVYFDYAGKTWLIQVWKGQYGICTGCEIGVYHADGIVCREDREKTIFHAVEESEMLDLSFELWRGRERIAFLDERHWWLTAFDVGTFSQPEQLSMDVSISFPDFEMKNAFYKGLLEQGMDCHHIFSFAYDTTIYFHVSLCSGKQSLWKRMRGRVIQCVNRCHCRLFCFITRYFCRSGDRILYLYLFFPFLCRHILRFRHFRKKRKFG